MNLIPKTVVAGVIFYILLMAAEAVSHPEILAGAIVGAVLLGVVAAVFLSSREEAVHTGEMALIWILILLFVLYGLLCWLGVIPWI